jgi:K+-sensing histidine kinase KdpD
MRIWTFLLVAILIATAALAAFNWTTFTTPMPLWFGVMNVEAPLGLLMLGAVALVTVVFLLAIGQMQSVALLEARRHAKELQANRELADRAEASRFTELRNFIETGLANNNARGIDTQTAVLTRLDQMEGAVTASIEQTGNSLAAYIGEVDDRLQRERVLMTER